jgi:hypothetical protein
MNAAHAAAVRRCLEELDVDGMARLQAEAMPHLPATPPDQMLGGLHYARTASEAMADRLRFYSHRWLLDHGYPSGLPDRLKPAAERAYPKVAAAVGISVNARSALFKPLVPHVRGAMESAVLEADADGLLHDTPHVRARMAEARAKTIRQLIGVH